LFEPIFELDCLHHHPFVANEGNLQSPLPNLLLPCVYHHLCHHC
jgi:hypothetical protein